ncbi:DUF2975 domain-containing protein [Holdemania massiliensis]|uniref:DUF2975 domain-containing protein n=1 Tax=Holdemania massiliensis TaxID=1468449 RepID=A0A6N7S3S8_9FIRM|nr:DUF2975 domain-containing protein [Holdemania massiliensis]MSA70667.1 DUF2975 domain-containing protein [Holdemania massiliensis]MSA88332.1 DUF2975 domain-containing protein [Holdemania massiliensis]MSB77746.1 DUF2975 domain-containing protein [Holdemania massiliensis]MSC32671.1 DUF2975 domain-containing protein [Holdemania massiliensis]MSC38992.1 DUF2975 domain-containing protein [Holdemania massiliensis]
MNNRKLAFLLKLFVFILAAMGLVVFALAIPELLHSLIEFYGRTFNEELPLQLLSASAALILYIALFLFWQICTRIGRNRSFCTENADGLRWICRLALFDTALCLLGCLYALAINILHPALILGGLGLMTMGGLIAVAAYTLAYLVTIAEQIQTENELMV